ncbi:MAG: hypothetical protein ACRYFX_10360 [Janthinobacterium lividum]
MTEYLANMLAEYGDVPPPMRQQMLYPTAHRYSICWRMGGGETHLMAWWPWWQQQGWDVAQRLAYFQKWPPPPMWLTWVADAVWDLDVDLDENEEQAAYAPYFAELERRG